MARGDSQSMVEQTFKQGYCRTEGKMTSFVSTLSPTGNWVCTTCSFRTKELLEEPMIKKPEHYFAYI